MPRMFAQLLIPLLVAAPVACGGQVAEHQRSTAPSWTAPQLSTSDFGSLVERLSEQGGFFDTDNLISNESSYLHVVGAIHESGLRGGVYIGVGPDQSFSYMAAIRPGMAFIVDIRRDNLLQHLLFKSLFAAARNRIEYLCLLTGRPFPDDPAAWSERPIDDLAAYIDGQPADREVVAAFRDTLVVLAQSVGVPLAAEDTTTMKRFHESFVRNGLGLRFQSFNRPPQPFYPTLRQLLLETDLSGARRSYLADEDDFQFLKQLQARNLVVPVVGDLAGGHALAAIGEYVSEQGARVSALYTSNVEFYLMRQRSFDRFAQNVTLLPHDEGGVIIRSYFNRGFLNHPQSVAGYYSTQLMQTLESFVDEYRRGGYLAYRDLVNKRFMELRPRVRR
jgi:hypothetical protein